MISKTGHQQLPAVLRCLFEEHRHLKALTHLLLEKAAQPERLQQGDYYLMRDTVGYLHDYPDEVHHPTENLLFEKVVRREPSMEPAVSRLLEDHEAVGAETQELLELLDEMIDEPGRERERAVRQACRAFVKHQQAHMQFENQELFPAAIDILSRSDWRSIERHFAALDDPLFGGVVANRHRLLYEYLMGPADRSGGGPGVVSMLTLERFILSAEIIEDGVRSWCGRILDLGGELDRETRSTLARTLHPKSLGSAVTLPGRYTLFLGKSLLDCSNDLARIWVGTVSDTLKLFGPGGSPR